MKLVKLLLKIVAVLVVLVIAIVLALPLWFGPVIKAVANFSVPKVVKADFHLGELSLNPYNGRFELGDLQLSNPEGFAEKYAAKIGGVVFDVEPITLTGDILHIEEITVSDVFVSVVKNGAGVGNFDQLKYNAAGGKEMFEAKQREAEAAKTAQAEKPTEPQQKEKPEKELRFIIDKMSISGLTVKFGILPIPLPPITLNNIGTPNAAATAEEVWQAVADAVMKAIGNMADGVKALGGISSKALKGASKLTGSAVNGTVDAVGGGVKQANEVVGDGVKKANEALDEGTKKTLDALKKLF